MHLTYCTLTGIDQTTSLSELDALSKDHPFVEWGMLYSPSRQGTPGRYPSIDHLHQVLQELPSHVQIALHICGDGVPNLLSGQDTEHQLLADVAARAGRVQLNFNGARRLILLEDLAALLQDYQGTTFITQHHEANAPVWEYLASQGTTNHAVLFDASGGQGIECRDWPAPLPIACGYAGGLGPHNLARELPRIAGARGNGNTWIDMEGKLRNESDLFDLTAAKACLKTVASWLQDNPS